MRLILAVAQRGSMLGAARELGVSVSPVSRRLTRFETHIGALVLERGVEGCRLTNRGESLAFLAKRLAEDLERDDLANQGYSGRLIGTIKITSGDGFVPFVIDLIWAFMRAQPDVNLEYSVEQEYRNVARGDVDVVIRLSHHGEPSLIYKKTAVILWDLLRASLCRGMFAAS